MSHAVVLRVQLEGDPEAGDAMLRDLVIPNAKAQAGFQKGIWMHTEGMEGMGVVFFDTDVNAKAAQDALNPPPGGPKLLGSYIYQVAAEA